MTLSKQNFLIGILVISAVIYGTFLFKFIPKDAIENNSALLAEDIFASSPELPSASGLPVRLKIPKINLDALVENVGLTPSGDMDVPKNPNDAGWFELGSRVGANGSAVIDGHYGFKDGKPSAFDNIYKLRAGDLIVVEDEEGASISFVVSGTRRFSPKADASKVFTSGDGKSHLNLITCEGIWDDVSQTYSERLVVFADKI